MRHLVIWMLLLLAPAAFAQEAPAPGKPFRDCGVCPEMVRIPAGSFVMGSAESEEHAHHGDERPQHRVTIARAFAIGRYEVTFDDWDACVRTGGCRHAPADAGWGRGRRPVIDVSWNDAKEYAAWLSRISGKNYRLPSEAEWEYAARAGTTSAFTTGALISPSQANFDSAGTHDKASGRGSTKQVGSYAPNAFGLYDVHGNVWEWVEDCRNPNYAGAPADGSAWLSGNCERRVLRGGSWATVRSHLRIATRNMSYLAGGRSNSAGFRVARD